MEGMDTVNMATEDTATRNRRIAKNTMMLYVRMLVSMCVGLYTGRVILDALGVENFGIYSAVAGVVGMSTMLTSSLGSAIGRFITFEIGSGNKERLRLVFSASLIINIGVAIFLFIVVESVGVWFLNNRMVIPSDRLYAANWVLQISVISSMLALIRTPFCTVIYANERISLLAYITIFEVFAKLALAYLITISPIDKLIFHAILLSSVSLIIGIINFVYARRNFEVCRGIKLLYDREVFSEIFTFAKWNLIGCMAAILRSQGGNILLNLYGGPAINAARGVADRVVSAVTGFSSNFLGAVSPQITKSYASGDRAHMMNLIYRGSRFSYYILLIFALPIMLNTDIVLRLWLKEVPDHTVLFIQLTLIYCMIESLSSTLIKVMAATGEIRNYQIVVGGFGMLNFPLALLFLELGAVVEVVVMVSIFVSIVCLGLRLYMLRGMVRLSPTDFIRRVVLNVLNITLLSSIIPIILNYCLGDSFLDFIVVTAVSVVSAVSMIYFIGCDKSERKFLKDEIFFRIVHSK